MDDVHLHIKLPAETMARIISAIDLLPIQTPEQFAIWGIQFALESMKEHSRILHLGLDEE
jgi:hypothetical protein